MKVKKEKEDYQYKLSDIIRGICITVLHIGMTIAAIFLFLRFVPINPDSPNTIWWGIAGLIIIAVSISLLYEYGPAIMNESRGNKMLNKERKKRGLK